jgi:HSP20 family protein
MRHSSKPWPLFVPEAPEAWKPLADVYRTPEGWLIKFDLAGVSPNDVCLTVHGRKLSVTGVRRDTYIDEGFSHYSMEISYNRFERTIEMPVTLENMQVTLQAKDGNLLVHLIAEGKENGR